MPGSALRSHVEALSGRGVKQSSILSTALFILVMNPLLVHLQQSGLGFSVNDLYAGGFLHADDIRTLQVLRPTLTHTRGRSR